MTWVYAPRGEGVQLRSPVPARTTPAVNGPAKILALQRLAGNRAVMQLLHREGIGEAGVRPVQRSASDDRFVDDDQAADYRLWSAWAEGAPIPGAGAVRNSGSSVTSLAGSSGTSLSGSSGTSLSGSSVTSLAGSSVTSLPGSSTMTAATPPRPWAAMAAAASEGRSGYMSMDEARRLFAGVKDREFLSTNGWMEEIPYDQAEQYCADRASHIALQLTSVGVACKRIFVVKTLADGEPGLWVNSTTAPGARPGAPVKLPWDYHVAIAVDAQDDAGRHVEMIFDPSVSPGGPISLDQWMQAVHADPEASRTNRIGESHQEAIEKLQQLREDDPSAPVNRLGFPLGSTWVLSTEPESVDIPKVDKSGKIGSWPLSSMDAVRSDFNNWRGEIEAQVENSHNAREMRERASKSAPWHRRLLGRIRPSGSGGSSGRSPSVAPHAGTPGSAPPSLQWPPNGGLALRRLQNEALDPIGRRQGPAARSDRSVYEMQWQGEQQPAPGRTRRRGTWIRRWLRGLR